MFQEIPEFFFGNEARILWSVQEILKYRIVVFAKSEHIVFALFNWCDNIIVQEMFQILFLNVLYVVKMSQVNYCLGVQFIEWNLMGFVADELVVFDLVYGDLVVCLV